jgi:hypothetical protein
MDVPIRHARVLSPYPPQSGGGALGVSGIQVAYKRIAPVELLDSRLRGNDALDGIALLLGTLNLFTCREVVLTLCHFPRSIFQIAFEIGSGAALLALQAIDLLQRSRALFSIGELGLSSDHIVELILKRIHLFAQARGHAHTGLIVFAQLIGFHLRPRRLLDVHPRQIVLTGAQRVIDIGVERVGLIPRGAPFDLGALLTGHSLRQFIAQHRQARLRRIDQRLDAIAFDLVLFTDQIARRLTQRRENPVEPFHY